MEQKDIPSAEARKRIAEFEKHIREGRIPKLNIPAQTPEEAETFQQARSRFEKYQVEIAETVAQMNARIRERAREVLAPEMVSR